MGLEYGPPRTTPSSPAFASLRDFGREKFLWLLEKTMFHLNLTLSSDPKMAQLYSDHI